MKKGNTNGETSVGLDAHKKVHHVAVWLSDEKRYVEWKVVNEPKAIRQMVKKVQRLVGGKVRFCYEAGPCGYALKREIEGVGVECVVVAPSLIPVKPGERIKTDPRDARKLADLLGAGLLTEVHAPSEEEESARDLCRCREQAQQDLMRSRHRLSKYLLRRGLIYVAGNAWTQRHRRWLRSLEFEDRNAGIVFEQYLWAIEHLEERLGRLDTEIEALAKKEPYRKPVGWLRCFRGISTVTAMIVVTELHDFGRFGSPEELMSYLGLVPSQYSSGERRQMGGITKTGNSHVRRVLVEAAWHYRRSPAVGIELRKRRKDQPAWVIAQADRAQQRLFRKFWSMCHKGKSANKAVVAVARELVGFLWAVMYHADEKIGVGEDCPKKAMGM
jgi:transposase